MAKVLLDIRDSIATLTLNSPTNFNALDEQMLSELAVAVADIDRRGKVRVVVLRGAGKAFCAGGDIARFAATGDAIHDFVNSLGPSIQAFVQWIRQTPAIVVAVVQGAVAGGGVGLMLAADVIIAAEDATVAVAYARLGTSPDAGASYFLARTLGYRKALELYLMSERLDGRQAKALGLVNFTAPPASLDAEAESLVRRLAGGPAIAYASAKRLFRQAADTALHQHLDDEIRLFSDNTRHPDFAEGVRAFLEKRPPKFAT
ncbi:MAG TPA: enoyl-CoA hydratase-related protein [Burkholderiaceae bacterium]|nr:enoyl-CoA hydratase-related protein [Burkholderiaceae bacterium]